MFAASVWAVVCVVAALIAGALYTATPQASAQERGPTRASTLVSPARSPGRGLVRMERDPDPLPQPMMLRDGRNSGVSPWLGPRDGRVQWEVELGGALISAPAVGRGGRTYWVTKDAFGGDLVALDPDGLELWRSPLGGGTHSTPALGRDGSIYTATLKGDVVAFADDGRERWRVALGGEILSSPLVDASRGRLVLSARDTTVALRLSDGKKLFVYNAGNAQNNSTPTLGPDGLIRITNWGGFAAAIAPTGEEVWRAPLGAPGFYATPTLGAFGTLYTAGESREIIALSPRGGPVWRRAVGGPIYSFLGLMPDGRLLVPVLGKGLMSITPGGDLDWRFRFRGQRPAATLAIDREGHVFLAAQSGRVVALDARGELVWALQLDHRLNSGPAIAAPVYGVPRMYLGSRNGVAIAIR